MVVTGKAYWDSIGALMGQAPQAQQQGRTAGSPPHCRNGAGGNRADSKQRKRGSDGKMGNKSDERNVKNRGEK